MELNKEQLCPKCLTGANSVQLDPREPFCPFFHLHSKNGCAGFIPITGGGEK
ncbi:MAG: hypothetical protein IKI97_08750 [Clostridia bacterium]|nr:hypothetical protein [Clostridia bacterium]